MYPNVNILFILFVITLLLIIGNIELNPGPELNYSSYGAEANVIALSSLNIRSIRNKIEFIENISDEFDFLLLNETHLNEQIDNTEIYIEPYTNNIQRKDRSNHGGGLLIYSKEDICITRLSQLENNFDEFMGSNTRQRSSIYIVQFISSSMD